MIIICPFAEFQFVFITDQSILRSMQQCNEIKNTGAVFYMTGSRIISSVNL